MSACRRNRTEPQYRIDLAAHTDVVDESSTHEDSGRITRSLRLNFDAQRLDRNATDRGQRVPCRWLPDPSRNHHSTEVRMVWCGAVGRPRRVRRRKHS